MSFNSSEMSSNSTFPENETFFPTDTPYILYFLSEIIVGVVAALGNALTLYVFQADRKLRRITNYYIVSLAVADFLLGLLGIPFAILTSLGLPKQMWGCLVMLTSLLVLCAISILSLVAVSIDRYWAVLYPLAYSHIMTGKLARRIILCCWFLGTVIGLLPAFGWYKETQLICVFPAVMDHDFLVFFYFAVILFPGLVMTFFYIRIYLVVSRQEKRYVRSKHGMLHHLASLTFHKTKQKKEAVTDSNSYLLRLMGKSAEQPVKDNSCDSAHQSAISPEKTSEPSELSSNSENSGANADTNEIETDLRQQPKKHAEHPMLDSQFAKARGKEIKAAKNLSIIIGVFFICWFPINTINCINAFCSDCRISMHIINFTVILSHANSAINPFLYAYNMKDFRRAFENFLAEKLKLKRIRPGSNPISTVSSTDVLKNSPIIFTSSEPPSFTMPEGDNSTSVHSSSRQS